MPLLAVDDASKSICDGAYDPVRVIHGCTYKDSSTAIICPTRGMIDYRVVRSWQRLVDIPNQRRSFTFVSGDEVADAYNRGIEEILGDWRTASHKYLLTLEDDNIPPPDAHLRLLDTIQSGPWDIVAGLYYAKNAAHTYPNAAGKIELGPFDKSLVDTSEAEKTGGVLEVNGVPMGCTLFKMDLFRSMPRPWFKTVSEYLLLNGEAHGRRTVIHDLDFCERARLAGHRIAVDCGVRVGHLDIRNGVIY